jgi:hypothetical protein
VNVIGFPIAFDLVEIFSVGVTLGRDSNLKQMPKVFDRAGSIFPRVFDPRSLFDLNHQASNLFLHRLVSTQSGHCPHKMRAFPERFLNAALKAGKSFRKPNPHGIAGV